MTEATPQHFQCLAHPVRLRVMQILQAGEKRAAHIHVHVGEDDITQSALSQHLSVLRKAGMIIPRRDSQRVFYSINPDVIKGMERFLKNLKKAA